MIGVSTTPMMGGENALRIIALYIVAPDGKYLRSAGQTKWSFLRGALGYPDPEQRMEGDEEGYITSDHQKVDKAEAKRIANLAGQLDPIDWEEDPDHELTPEDLWW